MCLVCDYGMQYIMRSITFTISIYNRSRIRAVGILQDAQIFENPSPDWYEIEG